jgi:hypothetical protein
MPRGAGRAGAGSSATRLHWAVEPTVRGGSHRFYERLGKLLDDAGFDAKVEELCAPHYAGDDVPGRPFSPQPVQKRRPNPCRHHAPGGAG